MRTRLLALVNESPGASTRRLAEDVGLTESTVAYHLRRIARSGEIRSEISGRHRRWFAARCGFCPILRRSIPILARPATAKVALALDDTPRTITDLAEAAELPRGIVRWAAASLDRTLLVERSRTSRVALRPGAEVCLRKAIDGQTCSLWGECPMSAAWAERLRAGASPGEREPVTSSR